MRYAIVEFLGLEQVEVVPALWVDDDRCAWPKHIKGDKVTAMVRKAAPPDALWQQFDVSVKGLFATYEQARKKLERSQYTSDLSSDNEMPPGKRVRRPPPQWSESDADPAPARPTKKVQRRVPTVPSDFPQAMVSSVQMQSSSSTGSENAGNLPDHPGSSSDDPCVHGDRQSRASSFEAFDDSNLTDIVTDIGGSQESVSFNEGHQARGREDPQDQEQGFKQHVLRLLNIVRFTVQQHGEMLNKLCEVLPSHAVVVRPRLVEQPFNKLDDLFAFDKTLVNEKAAMLVQEFRELGGKTASKATKSMLAHLLGDQLAAQFSWVGRKGKQNFSSLRTATAIVGKLIYLHFLFYYSGQWRNMHAPPINPSLAQHLFDISPPRKVVCNLGLSIIRLARLKGCWTEICILETRAAKPSDRTLRTPRNITCAAISQANG
ncbi:unnamed protein product, partial [Ixodes pacificus]